MNAVGHHVGPFQSAGKFPREENIGEFCMAVLHEALVRVRLAAEILEPNPTRAMPRRGHGDHACGRTVEKTR